MHLALILTAKIVTIIVPSKNFKGFSEKPLTVVCFPRKLSWILSCSTMTILIDNGHGSDTPGITRSDLLAADLYDAARKHLAGQKIRQYNDPKEPDFESNFFVLRHSKCPAVLTENLYQDCRSDVAFLQSSAGKTAIYFLITYYLRINSEECNNYAQAGMPEHKFQIYI